MRDKGIYFAKEYIAEILEAIDTGIFIVDYDGKIIGVNSVWEKYTNINRNAIIGRNVEIMLDQGYISYSITKEVLKQQKSVTKIINYKGELGKDVIVTGRPVFDSSGKLLLVVCTVRHWELMSSLYDELQILREETENYRQQLENMALQQLADNDYIAKAQLTKNMLQTAVRIANVDSSVLILGESGAGKDMLAKFIHKHSPRADKGNFIHVNCGAIPEALFESEFFGYASGAFTGASKGGKIGLFESADNGTIFLDEIAELPLFMQAKLLNVLQEKRVMRLGDTQTRDVNIRIIAATNKNLEELVAAGQFRQDLYYRLNVLNLHVPSLRQRKEDIPPLAKAFVEKFNAKYHQKKMFSYEAIEVLMNYDLDSRALITRAAV